MVTDDERRDVARRMRELEKCVIGALIPTGELAENILRAIDYGYSGAMTPYGRLADLIEPESERTCRVESSHEEEGDGCYSYFEYELTCGHEIARGDQLPPSYCPECGRRVLYDSNDYI